MVRRLLQLSAEGRGYLVWLIGGAIFAVPEIWASVDGTLPFPTLSGTVGHLERRWEIASLLVIIVVVNALMHGVRIYAARLTGVHPPNVEPRTRVTVDQATIRFAPWLLYFPVALGVVAVGFVVPLWVHGWEASDAEKQLAGEFGYGAMGLTFFFVPALLAYLSQSTVPFPGLFQTVLNLEAHIPFVAVLVAGCMTFLMLHLVFYPYPSIIPWFQNLEHLHNYCAQHPTEAICTAVKQK